MSTTLIKELKCSKYRLLGLVGQGQFGRVYCAVHRKTGHLVALKELDKQRFPTHKFLRELRFLLSLRHPNIVNCYALEHTSTGRYLIMDYCEGGTLRSLLEEDIRLHPGHGLKLIMDVLAGLDHAHNRGIIHCDIKPENILLAIQPEGWTARISDFGIARLNQEIARDGTGNTGSPAYMAPERFYGQYSQSSDLYAVGILLFELLVGCRPFSGPPAELMSAHLNTPIRIPDTVPAELRVVIQTALQKLPARRYPSAKAMREALQTTTQNLLPTFEQEWQGSSFLRFESHLPIGAFQFQKQEPLLEAIHQLIPTRLVGKHRATSSKIEPTQEQPMAADATVTPERLYQVSHSRIGCQNYPNGLQTNTPAPIAMVRLPESVRELWVCPQGCYATTQQSIYFLPEELLQPGAAQHGQKRLQQGEDRTAPILHVVPQLVVELGHRFTAAIAPNGRWMTTATQAPDHTSSSLNLWDLKRIHLTQTIPRKATHLFQMLVLDYRHVAVFSHGVDCHTGACITSVELEIFTRRGNMVGCLSLPIPVQRLLATPTPYRLLGLEPGHPTSILVIDLKPLRVLRIAAPIAPMLIAESTWGMVLVDATGQIVMLDKYGQGIGQITGPAHPTAIALSPDAHTLFLTTWNGEQGSLYTVDLGQLDLDILF